MGNTLLAPTVTTPDAAVKTETPAEAGLTTPTRVVIFIVILAVILFIVQQMYSSVPIVVRDSRRGGASDEPSPFTGKFAGWDQVPSD
jgi:hypothetical protein